MTRWSSVCLMVWIGMTLQAQPLLVDLEFEKIPQKKVRRFILHQVDNSVTFFTDMEASCRRGDDTAGFNQIRHIFHIDNDLSAVWSAYRNSSMAEAWNSRSVSFGVLFNKYTDVVLYQDSRDYEPGIDTGQVFFLNLKLLKGIYNMAVGMEIIDVDSINNIIRFSYVKGGRAEGAQQIQFFEEPDGTTTIVHSSVFRSQSHFRDRRLYPFFHEKLITEFHENILKTVSEIPNPLVLLERSYQLN